MGLSEWLRHLAESSISAKFREIDNHINVIATGVATNATGVATNATGVATNATGVATNATGVATNATGVATNANRIDAGETRIDMVVTEAASTATRLDNRIDAGETRLDNRIDKCTIANSQYIPPHMMPTLFTHLNSSSTQLPSRLPDTYRDTFKAARDMYATYGYANED
jgi:CCR4-NOT transcriptional regulation complex NOT5 subunit